MMSLELQGKWGFEGTCVLWKSNVANIESCIILYTTSRGKDLLEMGYQLIIVLFQMNCHIQA